MRTHIRAHIVVLATAVAVGTAACASDPGIVVDPSPSVTISVPERGAPVISPSGSAESLAAEVDGAASGDASNDGNDSDTDGEGEGDGGDDAGAESDGRSLDERAEAIARDLFDLANTARHKDGEDELDWSKCAAEQAVERAETALGRDELEHEKLEFDCTAQLVGENLVRGDGPAEALHELWMDSKTHRENILRDDYDEAGIGCVAYGVGERTTAAKNAGDIGGWVCSQMFYG